MLENHDHNANVMLLLLHKIPCSCMYMYNHVHVPLPPRARNDVLRSFPDAVVEVWNQLPQCVLLNQPTRKGLQTFKEKVNTHLRLTRWEWATDRL